MKDLKNMEDEEKVTVTEPIAAVLSESSFAVDHDGTIILTREVREAVAIAEHSYESGECLTEEAFKQRFSKWL